MEKNQKEEITLDAIKEAIKEELNIGAIREVVREVVKEEIADFKEEMTEFKKEMLDFKEEMTEFKKEMLDFKEEMTEFEKEMTNFKGETQGFINEMRLFRIETRENFEKINKKLGELDTVKKNQTAIINSIRSNVKDISKFKESIPIIEEKM